MVFASRDDAGRRLGSFLAQKAIPLELVLGLPRGGVIVAAEVARTLRLPLGALVVRKIGHPWFREFAVGALAEGGVLLLDEHALNKDPSIRPELDAVIEEERRRLADYRKRFCQDVATEVGGKAVLLVDDGLATGATTEAAVLSVRNKGARSVTVAAPVASVNAFQRLERVADALEILWVDPLFEAVGRFYASFPQTTDEEVLQCLQSQIATHNADGTVPRRKSKDRGV